MNEPSPPFPPVPEPDALSRLLAPAPSEVMGAGGAPEHGAVHRILPDAQGADPTVRGWVEQRRQHCAYLVLSWWWILAGAAAALAWGGALPSLSGSPPPLPEASGPLVEALQAAYGRIDGVLEGFAIGALLSSMLGVLTGFPAVPRSGLVGLALLLHAGCFLLAGAGPGSLVGIVIAVSAALSIQAILARRQAVCAGQEPFLGAIVVAFAWLLLYDWLVCLGVLAGVLTLVYAGAIAFRLLALAVGGGGLRISDASGPGREPPGGWPVFTILVPLYRERAVADSILRSLTLLDYPRERLDVKFLLEADDEETLGALQSAGIPPWAEVLVVPPGQPRTKPRACNHGLERARGEFLVIYDAEDRPDPDQLKQAVLAFRALPERVVCLQAQLAYHNHDQNLLTRWFALEYNVWFRRYLGGLERLGAPIPLGGTSNHFRTAALRGIGGWDPFNVTEDCDLGVRLHLKGWRTRCLASVTWEEANSRTGNWIRQRSRWLKGYLVTHCVWARRPGWLLWSLGPWATLSFLLSVPAVAVLAALNLLLWLLTGTYLTLLGMDMCRGFGLWELLSTRDLFGQRWSWPMLFHGRGEDPVLAGWSQVFFVASAALLAGNLLFILVSLVFGRRPGQRGLWWAALLVPFYWVLIAIGAWKGLWQMLLRPHYWEKTVHGLDQRRHS